MLCLLYSHIQIKTTTNGIIINYFFLGNNDSESKLIPIIIIKYASTWTWARGHRTLETPTVLMVLDYYNNPNTGTNRIRTYNHRCRA